MTCRQVTLGDGAPWGFRMHGGADAQLPLRIARVNPGSKAALRGIREGDLISSINGRTTSGLSNAEAHALLRSAQDTLTLGLNQGVTGSPKRRSQKLAQEIKEDNLKRTSVTSSSSSISNLSTITHTVSKSQLSNESTHTNGVGVHPFHDSNTKEPKSENLSNFTSYINNGSPFTTPQGAGGSRDATANSDESAAAEIESVIPASHDKTLMADNASGSSRSRRRKRNRKKAKKTTVNTANPPQYQVEFPTNTTPLKNMGKSRSLDDDDQLKITEVTETTETIETTLSESTAVVSEAESDWETVADFPEQKSEKHFGKLSVISLPLEEHITYETSHISPEDEKSLRDFLEGLNLVNSPEESVQRVESTDSVKKKPKKVQHFVPYFENPRYLDVISEEGSDLSDRECKQTFVHRVLDFEDDEDDVFETTDTETKLRNKFQTHCVNDAILVETKLIDNNSVVIKEPTWTTVSETKAEVVYLEDSSDSMTPSDLLEDTANDLDADDEEDISLDFDLNASDASPLIKPELSSCTDNQTKSKSSPPITPDNQANDISPPTDIIDFLQKLLSTLSNNNTSDIILTLNEKEAQHLPVHIKDKLKHFTESNDATNKSEIENDIQSFKQLISRENSQEKEEISSGHNEPENVSVEEIVCESDKNKLLSKETSTCENIQLNKDVKNDSENPASNINEVTNTGLSDSTAETLIKICKVNEELKNMQKLDSENVSKTASNINEVISTEVPISTKEILIQTNAGNEELNKELNNMSENVQKLDSENVPKSASNINEVISTEVPISTKETVIKTNTGIEELNTELKNMSENMQKLDSENVPKSASFINEVIATEVPISIEETLIKTNTVNEELNKELKNMSENLQKLGSENVSTSASSLNETTELPDSTNEILIKTCIFNDESNKKPKNVDENLEEPIDENTVLVCETINKEITTESTVSTKVTVVKKYLENKEPTNISVKKPNISDLASDLINKVISLEPPICTKDPSVNECSELNKGLKNICENLQNPSPVSTREASQESEELTKELKDLCDHLSSSSASRSDSASSARSSQCTAVYNPLHSSLSNIAAVLREGSQEANEPSSLKEVCVRALLTMPFGRDVIEELATVSKSLTCQSTSFDVPSQSQDDLIDTDRFSVPVPVMNSEKWTGLPTQENPNLLVCLSPAQKEFIDKTKAVPNEADNLLDLHKKFIERRGYHEYEAFASKPTADPVPTFKILHNDSNKNNLLKIIQESSTTELEPINTSGNISYNTYIKQLVREVPIEVEKQMNKPVNNKIYRGAPEQDRLKARHLGEWLNLARKPTQQNCDNPREKSPRRYSLPFNLYEKQMQYILEKERQIQQEIDQLQAEKSKLESSAKTEFDAANYQISRKGDIAIFSEKSTSSTEKFREQMYNEYMSKVAERQERKQNKVIKIKISSEESHETKHVSGIEDEFMNRVRERKGKLGLEEENSDKEPATVTSVVLPRHLQEFVDIANSDASDVARRVGKVLGRRKGKDRRSRLLADTLLQEIDSELTIAQGFLLARGVWSPGLASPAVPAAEAAPPPPAEDKGSGDEPTPPVWTPRSAGSSPTAERKEFRPVNFESPVLKRRNVTQQQEIVTTPEPNTIPPPWELRQADSGGGSGAAKVAEERRLTSSQSAPAAGLTSLGKLPRAQNPTITLLQKAREGQLPRGASYIEEPQPPSQKSRSKDSRPPLIGPNEILYTVKNEYLSESENEKPKKMADLGPRKFEGIGPTTKDGMPIVLRSIYDEQEVKEPNQAKWYKRMYDTLHRARNDDEYVTVRYKSRRGRYPYTSAGGYLSEPEPNAYDSDAGISGSKYATLDRRSFQTGKDKENEYITYTVPRNKYMSASVRNTTDVYKNQPGRIEDYVPGHSSISEKEAKEWWDEVMEIFDGHLEQQKHVPPSKSFMSHALKESGYESDSTLVFRRREDAALQLSPHDQKQAYKTIQKGGEVPLHGLRKLAPERPKDDSEIEYFPISPTLTRIRVHKNKPINEILCYPVSGHQQVFSTYKRSAPSSSQFPSRPPSPPKRRSSRNSHTLRLISTMTIQRPHSPKSARRHETCFKTTDDKSNVKFLRDRISCKLKSPTAGKKAVKITKTISSYPSSSKESITTVTSGKEPASKVKTRTEVTCNYSRGTAASTARRCCRNCSFSVPPKITEPAKPSDKIKSRAVSLERTFGSEKRKVDLILPKIDSRYKLVKSPDLISPSEVKKGVEKQKDILNIEKYPPGTTVKKSTSLFSSTKNGLKSKQDEKSLNVTVAFTARGKELLNSSLTKKPLKPISPKLTRTSRTITSSPVPSNISDKSRISTKSRTISTESLKSPTVKKRYNITKPVTVTKSKSTTSLNKDDLLNSDRDKKKNKKIKKDQSNEELKKDKKLQKPKLNEKVKTKKCVSKATGAELANKLKKMEKLESVPQTNPIKQQQEEIAKSDTFFQNLFLRNMISSPTPSVASKSSYILERTKMLQNHQHAQVHSEPTSAALKVYLSHRKPVSESKFKTLDREIAIRSRSVSPCGFGRSFSEHKARFDSISEVSNESRPITPDSVYSKRSSSLPATKIVFSETSRPVSPSLEKSLVSYGHNYRCSSPSPNRSPSRRKINSIRSPASITVEGKRKALRARSAGEAESLKREMYYTENTLTPSVSSLSLSQLVDPHEYKTYVTELRHSAKKSERFRELNRFYSSLERLSHLERTTSSSDLRPRRKDEEEIIDYDRWMQVRTRERAEQEFNTLYKKLQQEQKEKDLLFKTKDVENFKWKYNREFGLKTKENSVENIKEQFEKLKENETPLEISKRRILNYEKDIYKPLWRGNSVVNLVSKISEKRSQSESRVLAAKQKYYTERLLNREIGSKLWSSLSVEQVNALKNQLVEIYSNQTTPEKRDDYSINVDRSKNDKPKTLMIRRNSANELKRKEPQCTKSASIESIATHPALSETDKKRLSLSLSREVQDRMSQKRKYTSSLSIVLGKETRGAIAAAEAKIKPSAESTSPRTCYSLEPTEDEQINKQREDKNFVLVLTKDDEEKHNISQTLDEWAQPIPETSIVPTKKVASASETESASSDTSTKTAIFVGKKEDVCKKIEYFEKSANVDTYVPTIHRPAEDDDVTDMVEETPVKKTNLVTSQSYADLKELFGEKGLMKFATLPLSATRKSTSTSPKRPLLRVTNFSPIRTVSEASSQESIFRSRSISPDTDRFWNAYLTLIRGVDVHKMTKKFEHLKDFYSNRETSHRRCKSDSELDSSNPITDREFGDVYWLKKRYENLSRSRSRTRKISPIAKSTFKGEDRLMPHINIISKLASLYPKKLTKKERSIEDLARNLGCPLGEVEKIREKFESPERDVSLLGHMFTSSPNVHELRDIAPYLAGSWIAHQYPKYQDNSRSASAPEKNGTNRALVRKDRPRPKSASPPRSKKPSSILKPRQAGKDVFSDQRYEPSKHRPLYRYQPPQGSGRGRTRSWSPVAKHTVTFKGGNK